MHTNNGYRVLLRRGVTDYRDDTYCGEQAARRDWDKPTTRRPTMGIVEPFTLRKKEMDRIASLQK